MIDPEQLVGEEWAEWCRLSPRNAGLESEKLWQNYLALGGSLDPEPDTQSPFFDADVPCPRPAHGGPSLRGYGAAEFSRDIDFANVGDLAQVERALLAEEAMARKRDKLYWAPAARWKVFGPSSVALPLFSRKLAAGKPGH